MKGSSSRSEQYVRTILTNLTNSARERLGQTKNKHKLGEKQEECNDLWISFSTKPIVFLNFRVCNSVLNSYSLSLHGGYQQWAKYTEHALRRPFDKQSFSSFHKGPKTIQDWLENEALLTTKIPVWIRSHPTKAYSQTSLAMHKDLAEPTLHEAAENVCGRSILPIMPTEPYNSLQGQFRSSWICN